MTQPSGVFSKKQVRKDSTIARRAAERAKAARLKAEIKQARASRKPRIAVVRAESAIERVQVRTRAEERIAAVRATVAEIVERNRAQLAHDAEMAKLLRDADRFVAGKPAKLARAVRRSESDDEVRGNIDPYLVGYFDRVKRSIKGSPRRSRTEEFMQLVEESPDDVAAHMAEHGDDAADALIAEFQRRKNPRPAAEAFETRAVLAGRYVKGGGAMLTHLARPETDAAVCRKSIELADVYSLPASERHARPTCTRCAATWDRLRGLGKTSAVKRTVSMFDRDELSGTGQLGMFGRKNPSEADPYFLVETYRDNGDVARKSEARTAAEAVAVAGETPHSSIEVMSPSGWVIRTLVFSPKHPVDRFTVAKLEQFAGQASENPKAPRYAQATTPDEKDRAYWDLHEELKKVHRYLQQLDNKLVKFRGDGLTWTSGPRGTEILKSDFGKRRDGTWRDRDMFRADFVVPAEARYAELNREWDAAQEDRMNDPRFARSNPGRAPKTAAERAKVKAYKAMHWGEPGKQQIEEQIAPDPSGGLTVLGVLERIDYATHKGGEDPKTVFFHHFSKRSKGPFGRGLPLLCVNKAGGLIIVGGGYVNVPSRGIVG